MNSLTAIHTTSRIESRKSTLARLRLAVPVGLSALLALVPLRVGAQAAVEASPPPPAVATPVPATEPMPASAPPPAAFPTTSVGAIVPAAETEEATTPPPVAPPPSEPKLPAIHVAAWLRAGARVQGTGADTKKLNDQQLDTVYGELHADGQVFDHVSVTLNLNANGLAGKAGIEDAILGLDFAEPLHLWIGQLLVPGDRANYGGPFFMVPWNYPGILSVGGTTVFMTPKEGPSGRNAGAVLWGDIGGGVFKYMLGSFDNGDVKQGLLFSGRLSAALIGKEPGYFGNNSYFGAQDILSVAVGAQYQRKGSIGTAPMMGMIAGTAPTDNYGEFNADALGEFKLGGSGGWFTAEASYYHFVGDYQQIKDGFYALLALATPQVGIGNIQPMVRVQYGKGEMDKISAVDVFVNYLIKGPGLRAMLGYQRTDLGHSRVGNAIQLGLQAIFF
jgi:hypothetical protein